MIPITALLFCLWLCPWRWKKRAESQVNSSLKLESLRRAVKLRYCLSEKKITSISVRVWWNRNWSIAAWRDDFPISFPSCRRRDEISQVHSAASSLTPLHLLDWSSLLAIKRALGLHVTSPHAFCSHLLLSRDTGMRRRETGRQHETTESGFYFIKGDRRKTNPLKNDVWKRKD